MILDWHYFQPWVITPIMMGWLAFGPLAVVLVLQTYHRWKYIKKRLAGQFPLTKRLREAPKGKFSTEEIVLMVGIVVLGYAFVGFLYSFALEWSMCLEG